MGSRPGENAQQPHVPTDATVALVKQAAGMGLPHKMIGVLIGVSIHTLYKYYRDDPERGNILDQGDAEATWQVAKTLFHRATVGKDLGAAIFWLKCRAGWREKHILDDKAEKGTYLDLILASMKKPEPTALPAPDADSQQPTLQ